MTLGRNNKKSAAMMRRLLGLDTDDCINWPFSVRKDGYGRIRVGRKTLGTHRRAYELKVGTIPDGLCVLHRCDNRLCVNVRHLFLGTFQDNNDDRDKKQRHPHAATHGMAKLTVEQVDSIRKEYRFGSTFYGTPALARKYGVYQSTIYAIVSGRCWKVTA